MFERWSDQAKRVLAVAGEQAEVMGHREIAPEHLLLAIMQESEGVAVKALGKLGVGLNDVRDAILALHGSSGNRGDLLGPLG